MTLTRLVNYQQKTVLYYIDGKQVTRDLFNSVTLYFSWKKESEQINTICGYKCKKTVFSVLTK